MKTGRGLRSKESLRSLFLFDHCDRFGRALFSAYSASLAIFEIDFDRNGPRHHSFRAIKPANETGWSLIPHGCALGGVDFRPGGTPIPSSSSFTLAQLGMREGKWVCFLSTHQHVLLNMKPTRFSIADSAKPNESQIIRDKGKILCRQVHMSHGQAQ
jgi:hypothetical protein